MATYSQVATLDNYSPTDAKLQDFLTKWYAAFETGPLEQTSDTGQFDETTIVLASLSTSSSAPSYQVHRLNDSLFSTAPIYVKTGWHNSAGYLRYSVGFGTGTDGAGNLVGLTFPQTNLSGSVNAVDINCAVIGSGGEGYASVFTDPAMVAGSGSATSVSHHVGIFRTTNANDQPDARGALLVMYNTNSTAASAGPKYIAIDFQSLTCTDYGNNGFWQFGTTTGSVNPSLRKDVSRVVIPFANFTWVCPYLLGIYRDEHSYGAPFVADPTGNPHQYQPVKSAIYSGVNVSASYAAVAVIWE